MKKKENEKKYVRLMAMSAAHQNEQAIYIQSLLFCLADNCIGILWCDNIDMRNKQCVLNLTQELLYFSILIIIDNKSTS